MSDCDQFVPLEAQPAASHTGNPPPHAHATPAGRPAAHHHRILGRITRHSRVHRTGIKRAYVPLDGCPKRAVSHAGAIPFARAATAALPAISALSGGTAVAGGSFVLGGFGGDGGSPVTPIVTGAVCQGISCLPGSSSGIILPEPISLALLATAAMMVLALRKGRKNLLF